MSKRRNFGHGRQMKYAAKMALKEYMGERHGTVASHVARFSLFALFCKMRGTTNAVFVTQALFE